MSELQTTLILFILTLVIDLERRMAKIEAKVHEIYKYITPSICAPAPTIW